MGDKIPEVHGHREDVTRIADRLGNRIADLVPGTLLLRPAPSIPAAVMLTFISHTIAKGRSG